MSFLAPIVEGHGEREAVPALLHRIAREIQYPGVLVVNQPIIVKSGSFLHKAEYFRKYVLLAAEKAAQENGVVVILLDCEDGCPAKIGPELLLRACEVRNDVEFIVSLAYREFETWFMAGVTSLRGLRGLPNDVERPADPEKIRDAKGWLGQRMEAPYDPVTHQVEFVRKFDMQEARSNQSFDRFFTVIQSALNRAPAL